MRAIEYNIWNTVIKLLTDKLPTVLSEYDINTNSPVDVLPAYPRDLTDMRKPSIIVRKVDTSQYKMSLDGFIGQYLDGTTNTLYDIKGIGHNSMIQFDVVADSNIQSSLLISIISEEVLNAILLSDIDRGKFTLYDFTVDVNNPQPIGIVTILNTSDITGLSGSDRNHDYTNIIRSEFNVVQTIVPAQEFVDLSKWIKQKQTIYIKGGN
jgi:hypothetical protein